MTTLALGLLGGLVNPAVGALGAAAGSIIDRQLLFPALFGDDPTTLDVRAPGALAIQSFDEGLGISFFMGPENRVAGQVIWQGEIRDLFLGLDPRLRNTNFGVRYTIDLAIAIGEGPITKVRKIWGDGKLIFGEGLNPNITVGPGEFFQLGLAGPDAIRANPVTDLTVFQIGAIITISGSTAVPSNNGTYKVVLSEFRADVPSFDMRVIKADGSPVIFTPETSTAIVIFWDKGTLFDEKRIGDVTFHLGDGTNTVDPIIEAAEGVGNVPEYRNLAYVVFDSLSLTDFGNRIPGLSFLVEKEASTTAKSAFDQLLLRSGLTSSEFDTTALVGVTPDLRGMTIVGPQEIGPALKALMLYYDIKTRELGGKLVFFPRAVPRTLTIPVDDLAAHEHETVQVPPVSLTDINSIDLPKEVVVKYLDPDTDFQPGAQRERRIDAPSDTVLTLSLPLVTDSITARDLAKRELWTPWVNRQLAGISIPPKFLATVQNDLITFTAFGQIFTGAVRRIERGSNMLHVVDLVVEDVRTLDQAPEIDPRQKAQLTTFLVPFHQLEIIDIAPLTDEAGRTSGFYSAVGVKTFSDPFFGSELFQAPADDAGNPTTFAQFREESTVATIGRTLTALGPVVTKGVNEDIENTYTDRLNTLDVELYVGALESHTELETLNGANLAIVGEEIIAFQNATLIGLNQFRLDTLFRGLKGTEREAREAFLSVHVVNERFILLTDPGIRFNPLDEQRISTQNFFRAVAKGADFTSQGLSQEKTFLGRTIVPFPVAHLKGVREINDDITISWVRRSRFTSAPFTATTVAPLTEPDEKYEVDIVKALPPEDVKRTFKLEDTTTVTYTAAQQTADGFPPPDIDFNINVFQMSDRVGRGRLARIKPPA